MGPTHHEVAPDHRTPLATRLSHFGARLAPAWTLAKRTVSAWTADNASSKAAALAYFAVFSLLLIAITIAGALLGAEAARGEIHVQLKGMVGESGARAVEQLVASAAQPGRSLGGTVVGVLVLTLAATGAFEEMQDALNAFWRVPPQRIGGVLPFLKRRIVSVVMVLSVGFLLLAVVLSASALSAFRARLPDQAATAVVIVNYALSFAVVTAVFAMIFKYLPQRKVMWSDVWAGALVTSSLFELGKLAIALYLAKSAFASAYGAVGALAVVLAWVYYSSMIVLLGAEFTQVFAHTYGSLRDAQ